MIGQPSRLCFLYAEGLVPPKQHYSGVWCIPCAHTCSHWTSAVGRASCACMRSLAFRRGMGDSAQCLLLAGAVTLSHKPAAPCRPPPITDTHRTMQLRALSVSCYAVVLDVYSKQNMASNPCAPPQCGFCSAPPPSCRLGSLRAHQGSARPAPRLPQTAAVGCQPSQPHPHWTALNTCSAKVCVTYVTNFTI
jgi:hypothetical protein